MPNTDGSPSPHLPQYSINSRLLPEVASYADPQKRQRYEKFLKLVEEVASCSDDQKRDYLEKVLERKAALQQRLAELRAMKEAARSMTV